MMAGRRGEAMVQKNMTIAYHLDKKLHCIKLACASLVSELYMKCFVYRCCWTGFLSGRCIESIQLKMRTAKSSCGVCKPHKEIKSENLML